MQLHGFTTGECDKWAAGAGGPGDAVPALLLPVDICVSSILMQLRCLPQVDVTTERRVRVDLEVPYPPFFFQWSPCGTRLAMLSNWHHMQCAALLSSDEHSEDRLHRQRRAPLKA